MASRNPINATLGATFGDTGSRDDVLQGVLTSLGAANGGLPEQLTTLAQQLQQLQAINQADAETIKANTQAVAHNNAANVQNGSSSAASTIGNTIKGVLGFGLGVSPLISGLMSLFGGGESTQPSPLVPFAKPAAVRVDAGISSAAPGETFAVDSAQGGLPRPVTSGALTQITVQVQAMDSRSFLDHSQDIAMAVRQAMLESSALNDVIRET